ncbi:MULTISPECIES: EscU/YscU/HrcU family type III secretion system export apparatus switch protein [Lacrimispora]|jgi:flagellar biosynthesis protein|uniref:EscU/YscU/HrcU family type III secretion system export apparatus switch protein n=1 Tax=Lacrimispora TaxID=2719231 RepID=UPI000BE30ECF|nr:EscU/YscU/HrcU family type III secretion system export apparatus switch protein [Lacrimispora amygdalina]MDK2968130.1 flagellar biosynthesis protein [Lacrimispora sp.]
MSEFKSTLNKKAVALKYDDSKNTSPVIVASGMGYTAEKIVEMANENGIPVYEDNSLATMLTQLELGSQIPEELYQTIVDIYLYFLDYVPGKQKIEAAEDVNEAEEEETNIEETVE